MKRCKKCGIEKPLEAFHKANGTRDGRRGECIECFRAYQKARYPLVREREIERARRWREENVDRFRETQRRRRTRPEVKRKDREYHLKRKFGITLADYDRMLLAQGGGCAICGAPPPDVGSLHVDHDPATEAVRGLLCFSCNNALGDFRDRIDLLHAAVEYLDPPPPELVDAVRGRVAELVASVR